MNWDIFRWSLLSAYPRSPRSSSHRLLPCFSMSMIRLTPKEIDALFKLPLTEFVGARKALAARLKQNGFVSEAEGVRALAKPSISAWTVNQLYFQHREAFDELIATGQRFRKAQATGKM